jgi:hypothetical protein
MVVANGGDAAQPLTATAPANARPSPSSNTSKPLTLSSSSIVPLYDPACMLLMDKQLARGYITLLSGKAPPPEQAKSPCGSKKKNKNEQPQQHVAEDAVTLGFIAVTDGNVIEACFGIKQRDKDNRAQKTVLIVKDLLREASHVSDAIPQLAVEAYWNAFGIVVELHQQVDKLNFVTRCLFYPGLVKKALADLKTAFGPLEEALRDST